MRHSQHIVKRKLSKEKIFVIVTKVKSRCGYIAAYFVSAITCVIKIWQFGTKQLVPEHTAGGSVHYRPN
jgi:hypothetical protein